MPAGDSRGRSTIVYSSGIMLASAIASAAGFASLRRFGRGIPASIQLVDLVEELVDEDLRGHLLQDSAVGVHEADLAASRDPEVRVTGLARAVHGAAHDCDLECLRVVAQPLLDDDREALDADVVAPARRAGDHHRPALAKAERLEDLPRDLDLLDRVGRERDAHACRRCRPSAASPCRRRS